MHIVSAIIVTGTCTWATCWKLDTECSLAAQTLRRHVVLTHVLQKYYFRVIVRVTVRVRVISRKHA